MNARAMRWLTPAACLTIALMVSGTEANAQGRTDSARPLGMASAFTASGSGNGAIYHNPAGVGAISVYTLEGSYFLSQGINTLNASVVDSKLNPKLAAGLAYSFEFASDDSDISGHDGRLALAVPLVPQRVIIGIGGRYMKFTQGKEELLNTFTLDVGTILRVTDNFLIGVSGNNLIDACKEKNDPKCPVAAAPRSVGGGIAIGSSAGFQITGDFRADFSPDGDKPRLIYAFGAEALLASILALRGGYQFRDLEDEHVMALGGGLKTNGIGIDVGYQFRFASEESLLSVALQFSFF